MWIQVRGACSGVWTFDGGRLEVPYGQHEGQPDGDDAWRLHSDWEWQSVTAAACDLLQTMSCHALQQWYDPLTAMMTLVDYNSKVHNISYSRSSAVAVRPRDASCLSVVSFNIPTAQYSYRYKHQKITCHVHFVEWQVITAFLMG